MIGPTRSVVTVERGHSERGHHVARLDPSSTEVRLQARPACEGQVRIRLVDQSHLPVSSGFLEANFVCYNGLASRAPALGNVAKV